MESERTSSELPARTAAKRPWHTPKLEEVDYTATENGVSGFPDLNDMDTYAATSL